MNRTLVAFLVAAALAACQKSSDSGDTNARLARLEKRVDKIIEVLGQAMGPAEPDPKLTYSVPVHADDPTIGPDDAKITIVEGYEFLCPYCWKAAPTIDQLIAEYGKDLRVVSKYLVIHGPPALPPGLAACAADRQGKYPEMKKLLWSRLFDSEGQMHQDQITPDNMTKLAAEAGLDMSKFNADFTGQACQEWVKRSQENLRPVGTTGTPSFYINGRHIGGALPVEEFRRVIQEELAKADKAIAAGTKQSEYYAKMVVEQGEKKVKSPFED